MTTPLDVIDRGSPDQAKLLQRRMIALRLDVGAWARFEPTLLGNMQSVCATCESRKRCADDLREHADDPTSPVWRDYCPNAVRLDMLVALQFY